MKYLYKSFVVITLIITNSINAHITCKDTWTFSKWSENEAKQTPAMEMEELKSQAHWKKGKENMLISLQGYIHLFHSSQWWLCAIFLCSFPGTNWCSCSDLWEKLLMSILTKRGRCKEKLIYAYFFIFFNEFLLYYKHKSISNISNAQKKELQKPNLLITAGVLTYLHCEANLKGVHCLFPKIHAHIWTPSLSHEALILTWQI